jgi:hypothetical protein
MEEKKREKERKKNNSDVYNLRNLFYNYVKNTFLKFNLILDLYRNRQKKLVDKFLAKLKIIDSGYRLIRIGADTDGGYLIPDILNQIEFVFSPGVGETTSFEDNLGDFKIKSFLADGTVNYNGNHDFIKKNLNCFNDENNITLETWVNEKVKDKSNDKLLLQMDIEGSEIEVLYQTDTNLLARFKCIVIEFHHFNKIIDKLGLKIYSNIFDKILKTHFIVHIHPNNNSNISIINNNKIPALLEITFINKKITRHIKKISNNLPHELDKDCVQNKPHIKCPEIFYK